MIKTKSLRYWSRFERIVGGLTLDSSGNNVIGTVMGATPTLGDIGNCFNFDGTNDCVNLSPNVALSISGDLTVIIRLKFTDSGGTRFVVNIGGDDYGIYTSGGKVFGFHRKLGTFKSISSIGLFNDDTWHTIAFAKNNTNMKLYIDKVLNNQNTDGGETTTTSTPDGSIGKRNNTLTSYYKGLADEPQIYARELSLSDIQRNDTFLHPLNG